MNEDASAIRYDIKGGKTENNIGTNQQRERKTSTQTKTGIHTTKREERSGIGNHSQLQKLKKKTTFLRSVHNGNEKGKHESNKPEL